MRRYISTTLAPAIASRTKLLVCAAVIVGALGIFVVPWFIPFQQPVTSLSYTFGFNNLAAWLAAAALLAALCFILLLRNETLGTNSLERRLSEILPNDGARHNRDSLFAMFVAVAVCGAALQIAWYSILPTNYFGEIKQHIPRLDLMTLGRRPHLDFQYNFGPGMLYPAYGLYRLGAGTLSIDAAYCITLSAYWILGTYLAYYVVKSLNGAVKRTTVFLCISLLFLNPTMMGLQYTPLRYLLPLASLLFVHHLLATTVAWRYALAAVAAFLLPLIALSFSPEIGIATTLALTVYFLVLIRTPLRMFSYCALASALAIPFARAAFGRDYLGAVQSYSSAVSNFPVFPTILVLAFLVAVCMILPNLAIIGLRQPTPVGALALAFTIVLGLEIPPALGRCDVVHICFNGIGVILFLLVLLTTLRDKRLYYTLLCAYLLIFPFCELGGMLWLGYGPQIREALHDGIFDILDADKITISYARSPEPAPHVLPSRPNGTGALSKGIRRPRSLVMTISHRSPLQDWVDFEPEKRRTYGKPRYFSSDLSALLSYDKIGIPFGTNEEIDRFLKMTDRFIPEYWPPRASCIGTSADLARKLHDLDTMGVILVPRRVYLDDNFFSIPVNPDLSLQNSPDPAFQRKKAADILRKVNMFPIWLPKVRNSPFYYEVRIMAEIRKHYVPVGEFREYLIAKRRTI